MNWKKWDEDNWIDIEKIWSINIAQRSDTMFDVKVWGTTFEGLKRIFFTRAEAVIFIEELITATVNKPTDYVVSISDLEKFIEGEK